MAQNVARILLVDDEPQLTKLMQTYLAKLGYTVDSCLDAAEALGKFEKNDHYDLLVADVTLPDMPGDEMALKMLDRQPTLRILLTSGYPGAVESLPKHTQSNFTFLQKPFLPNMLARAIEELLKRAVPQSGAKESL